MGEAERSPAAGAVAAALGAVGARSAAAILIVGLAAVPSAPVAAQDSDRGDRVAMVALNALTGGLTSAVSALLGGRDPLRAAVGGGLGGVGVYAGKQVAAQRFDGAGLMGRELAAVGTSVVINAGEGRGWFGTLWLPAGPVWVRTGSAPLSVRVSAVDVAMTVWAAATPELGFDAGRSLSTGAMVFTSPDHAIRSSDEYLKGFAAGGVMVLGASVEGFDGTRSHEMIHVIQQDFMLRAWSRPLEAWAWTAVAGRDVPVDLGLVPQLLTPGFYDRFRERESSILDVR